MRSFLYILDILGVIVSGIVLPVIYIQSRLGAFRLPLTYRLWDRFKVTPVSHHYYQPIFDVHELPDDTWAEPNEMVGVDLNEAGQLLLLDKFNYQDELIKLPRHEQKRSLDFHHNDSFGPADAEMLYNMVRHFKPNRVIEIGSGYSTRMMKLALDKNRAEGTDSTHICIEPYEMPWLESLGVDEVVREKVENLSIGFFDTLEQNDILFIDSSHVIRPGGDVLYEFLNIIPKLRRGVIVHVHDVFLPYEYPRQWIVEKRRFWNEQYLLHAFLAFNSFVEVLAAVHWLDKNHPDKVSKACPVYGEQRRGSGSFWFRKTK